TLFRSVGLSIVQENADALTIEDVESGLLDDTQQLAQVGAGAELPRYFQNSVQIGNFSRVGHDNGSHLRFAKGRHYQRSTSSSLEVGGGAEGTGPVLARSR